MTNKTRYRHPIRSTVEDEVVYEHCRHRYKLQVARLKVRRSAVSLVRQLAAIQVARIPLAPDQPLQIRGSMPVSSPTTRVLHGAASPSQRTAACLALCITATGSSNMSWLTQAEAMAIESAKKRHPFSQGVSGKQSVSPPPSLLVSPCQM